MLHFTLLLLLGTFSPVVPAAQSQPDVEILKFGWRKLPPRSFPAGKRIQAMKGAAIDMRIREEYSRPQPDYSRIRELEAEKRNLEVAAPDVPRAPDKPYKYNFRFKNKSPKQVTSLTWVYLFKDAATGQELVRHSFNSQVEIRPGAQKEVVSYTDSGPPMVVNAKAKEKGGKEWKEEVIMEEVRYSDGSKWSKE